MKEHIQDSLEIVREDEEAYLNDWLYTSCNFEGYKYD
jgi:hypothetical protein